MAVKLLLDNNISDWGFIVIICNVLVPAGHRQHYGFVLIGAHKPLVRDGSHFDDLTVQIEKPESGERKETLSRSFYSWGAPAQRDEQQDVGAELPELLLNSVKAAGIQHN